MTPALVVVAAWGAAAVALAIRRWAALGAWCAAVAAAGAVAMVEPRAALILPAVAAGLLLALPEGRLGSAPRRIAVGALAGAGAAVMAVTGDPAPFVIVASVAAALAATVPAAYARYRAAPTADRQRLQLAGAAVTIAASLAAVALPLGEVAGVDAAAPAALGATALVPPALAAGTWPGARRRAGRWLTAGVSAGAVAVALVVVMAAMLLALGELPRGGARDLFVPAVLGAAVGLAIAGPLRRVFADMAAVVARGVRRPPEEVARAFAERASRGAPLDELLEQLAESLRRAMALRRVEVWVRRGGVVERVASIPAGDPAALELAPAQVAALGRVPVAGRAWLDLWVPSLAEGRAAGDLRAVVARQGATVLGLVVLERGDDEPFGDDDDLALAELGRRVGVVLHNRELDATLQETPDHLRRTNEELRASRARLVAAADAERRRIERDLHDGAQQHLVALAIGLRLAADTVAGDPTAAAATLDQLAADAKATIEELRTLAHGIYPPLLMDSGLGPALAAAAARSPLAVTVDADAVGRHPAEVEAAVYFCCMEALQNAAKHAAGSAVAVRLCRDGAALRFVVRDDGPGFDPTTVVRGHGFENMHDRIGAIGGTLTVEAAPGRGTAVAGVVPVVAGG